MQEVLVILIFLSIIIYIAGGFVTYGILNGNDIWEDEQIFASFLWPCTLVFGFLYYLLFKTAVLFSKIFSVLYSILSEPIIQHYKDKKFITIEEEKEKEKLIFCDECGKKVRLDKGVYK